MAKVTYTKAQLEAFTVKEMKTLSLFSKINPKGLDKKGIVKALISAQKAEQKALKKEAKESEIKEETSPITEEPVVEAVGSSEEVEEVDEVEAPAEEATETTEEAPAETVEENETEEDAPVSSEKVHFHRPIRRRNPMNFR